MEFNTFKSVSCHWYQISYLIKLVIELKYILRLYCFIKMIHYLWIMKFISNIFPKVSHAITLMRCRVDYRNHILNTWMPIRNNAQLITIIYIPSHLFKIIYIWGITFLVHNIKETANIWFSASCAIVDNRNPSYFPLRMSHHGHYFSHLLKTNHPSDIWYNNTH